MTEQHDWNRRSLRDLMRHIVRCHHAYLRHAMPALHQQLQRLQALYGTLGPDPALGPVFAGMWDELDLHMDKEETLLFPYLDRLEAAAAVSLPHPFAGARTGALELMEDEHESATASMREIRLLTNHYSVPELSCPTYSAFMNGLRQLESDLHLHIHLENNILFPRARLLM
ncbi:MAG: hemerythrin domain-containing protein [Bryobacterales bacterium]|nr:hemerythrin domain-containing protein [Bryobacterales bacterium]